jgi:Transcriptional regulatory protein, C terminal
MQRRDRRTNPRQTASRHNPSRWAAIKANNYPLSHRANRLGSATADGALEFGRIRVLLRQRQLLADGVRLELGTRAFDLLVVLLEADGSLVTKEELLGRVWPGIVVSEENLKVQVSRCAKRSARTAVRSALNSAGATDLPACSARLPRRTRAILTVGKAAVCPESISHSSEGLFPIPPRNAWYRSERPPRSGRIKHLSGTDRHYRAVCLLGSDSLLGERHGESA